MKKVKLFCLPYAGGSAVIYKKWQKYLATFIELHPIEYPGRGRRFNDNLCLNMDEIVNDSFEQIKKCVTDNKYAIFGYSMGSIIAYELTKMIERSGCKLPEYVFVAARHAPHIKGEEKNIHLLGNEEFKKEVYKFGGITKEVYLNNELMDIFVDIIRADFKVVNTYRRPSKEEAMNCNVSVLYGKNDCHTYGEINEWTNIINGNVNYYEFDGDHFFINTDERKIISIINNELLNL